MKIFYYLFWDAYRFFKALFTGKKLKASKEEAKRRLDICYSCPLINLEGRILNYKQPRCSICGCFLGLKSKLRMESCSNDPPRWTEEL